MGYYSSIYGEIIFSPPASWTEIRDLGGKERLFRFEVESEEVETDTGTLIKRSAQMIVPEFSEQVKAYSVVSDLEKLVSAVPGRSWSGEFRIEGEGSGDVKRLFVADGAVTLWDARLLWPDGTSEPGR